MSDKPFREHTVEDTRRAFQRVFLDGDLDDVRVSRKTLSRLYGAARQHVECEGECFTADVTALKEAESALGRDGPYLGDSE